MYKQSLGAGFGAALLSGKPQSPCTCSTVVVVLQPLVVVVTLGSVVVLLAAAGVTDTLMVGSGRIESSSGPVALRTVTLKSLGSGTAPVEVKSHSNRGPGPVNPVRSTSPPDKIPGRALQAPSRS